MIFKKLELKNFKSHEDTTIDFNTGITLIVGENGAGKSSIFEAITFALFKESPEKNTDLVKSTNDPNDRVRMEVKLTFESNANTYRVERTLTKTRRSQTPTARILKIDEGNEETIVEGTTEVTKAIGHILNMNSKTFTNSIHIKQGEISNLIDATPGDRKELIGQLLRLDDLKIAHKEMPKVINDYEMLERETIAKITPEEELNSELSSLNEERNSIIMQTNEFQNTFEKIEKENELKTGERTRLDEQKAKLEELTLKLETEEKIFEQLNKTHEELAGKLNEITENEKDMASLKPFTEKFQIFKDFKDSLFEYNQLKQKENSIRETLENIKAHKEILENEKENHDKYLQLDSEIRELTIEEAELTSDVKSMEELESELQRLQNDLNDKSNSLDDVYKKCEETLSNYDEEIDYGTISLDELEKHVGMLKDNIRNELTHIDEQINEHNNQIGGIKQEKKSSEKALAEITEADDKCPTCQSQITPDKKNELINSYENTISDSNERLNEINESINRLNGDKTLKNSELSELESIENIIQTNKHVPELISTITSSIEEHEEKIADLKVKQDKLSEAIELRETKSRELKSLESNYKNYLDSQTLLNNFDDEETLEKENSEISPALKEIELELNKVIETNPALSLEISNEDLNNEIEKLSEQTKRYNILEGRVKDKAEYENKLKENDEEIENKEDDIDLIKKGIESCDYDSENHANIIKTVDELGEQMQTLNTNIAVNQTNLANTEEKIKALQLKMEENRKYLEKLSAIEDYIYILEDFREHYGKNGIQKDLRSQSTPLIQKYAREFFDKFNFNYSDLKLSDEYDISVYGPKGKVKLGMVSGGEKISIALSLRLAITKVMSEGNIETILLDEPTIHLDNYRRQELITVLQSMSVIPQMIIVTHDEELETAADTLIKIEKQDGISHVIDDE